ncbi:molybdenum cofactor biosynthesis protein [Punctularia strigosozonata HHB-11173 SS5]|uniref:molybdenum cofactor biosynthesis protein n=1 Tax=Punctularia strigosozonata (strain HHB-11173) TaxID=741275 RepID=UPI0004416DF1|nr:molybdenum cofactor biosynthesis protein [Punctularia strigosozonata HHB-11173 SS5]EIN11072.1 molybdenum cofactor biosynthesis protein [Punctularia strigosozonata HHB-11173 SS5]
MTAIRVGVLTVSDTAFNQGAGADKSGPAIRDILHTTGSYEVTATRIVPDDSEQLRDVVRNWCASGEVDWVITTGGTGFGVRDRTPEAVAQLITRPASGIVHLLLSSSLKHTPLAALSRPVAGVIESSESRGVLVVTLPGSVKAVRENLHALLDGGVVAHAVELLRGGTGKNVHQALAQEKSPSEVAKAIEPLSSSHHHRHGHTHSDEHGHQPPKSRTVLSHDPSQPISVRNRVSPYPLIDLDDAISIVLREVQALPITEELVTPALRGHILAEEVHAPQDVPANRTTNVDGYAVRSTDKPGIYRVVTPASHPLSTNLKPGDIYRINTGAPLPAGADAVIMVEDTKLVSADDAGEEKEVETLAQVEEGENVRAPGSDVRKGELVLAKGELVRSLGGEIGTLAFVGRKQVSVYKKPVVAIMSTGNELADLQSGAASSDSASNEHWKGIWDTNRPSLQAALEGMGYDVIDYGIIQDSVTAHTDALRAALGTADIVLTTGGTSMGPSDLLKPVIERELQGHIHFGRVKVKPGKPTTFAMIPVQGADGKVSKPLFALPGNPASALVCFFVFVVPALRRLGGIVHKDSGCQLPRISVKLDYTVSLDPRPEFQRVIVSAGSEGLKARNTGGQRSSRAASMAGANALVALPAKAERTRIEAGEMVDAIIVGEIEMEQ